MTAPLYNREILALAVACAEYPRLHEASLHAQQRAPLCGSQIALDLTLDAAGAIAMVGMKVEACALGQAAATLFARAAPGRTASDCTAARGSVAAWLAGRAAAPGWPGFEMLSGARAHPARHGAILLPFDTAIVALGRRAEAAA